MAQPNDSHRTPMDDRHEWPTVDLSFRHPATIEIIRYFSFDHLDEPLRAISRECTRLAYTMVNSLSDGPELTAGLRKLLEAKDCFVRQMVNVSQ